MDKKVILFVIVLLFIGFFFGRSFEWQVNKNHYGRYFLMIADQYDLLDAAYEEFATCGVYIRKGVYPGKELRQKWRKRYGSKEGE